MQIKSVLLNCVLLAMCATVALANVEPGKVAHRRHHEVAKRFHKAVAGRDAPADPAGAAGGAVNGTVPDPAAGTGAVTDPSGQVQQFASGLPDAVAPLLQIAAAVDINIDLFTSLLNIALGALKELEGIISAIVPAVPGGIIRRDDPTSAITSGAQSAAGQAMTQALSAAQSAAQNLLNLNIDLSVNVQLGDLLNSLFSIFGALVTSLTQVCPGLTDVLIGPLTALTNLAGSLVSTALNPLESVLGAIQ